MQKCTVVVKSPSLGSLLGKFIEDEKCNSGPESSNISINHQRLKTKLQNLRKLKRTATKIEFLAILILELHFVKFQRELTEKLRFVYISAALFSLSFSK